MLIQDSANPESVIEALQLQSCNPDNDTSWGKETIDYRGEHFEIHDTCNLHRYFAIIGLINDGEEVTIPNGYSTRIKEIENPDSIISRSLTEFQKTNPAAYNRLTELASEQLRMTIATYSGSDADRLQARKMLAEWLNDHAARDNEAKELKIRCSMFYDFIVDVAGKSGYDLDLTAICS